MEIISEGIRVLKIEANAILDVIDKIDKDFEEAVKIISECKGKVILTGMGKSGLIARKMASTLSSTGTPSFFIHPAEASHGDLGMISVEDVVIAISNSGESSELFSMLKFVERNGIKMIALTAKKESSLAKTSQVTLDISVREEACPLGLAPTSSTTVSLALCDAIAMSVLKLRGFNEKDFAEFHPGGSLGKRLLTRVKDVMHESTPSTLMKKSNSISEVISLMTSEKVKGVAGVVDENDNLIGIVTDGDIRRGLKTNNSNFLSLMLVDIMSKNPKTIHEDEMAEKALFVMQQFQIQSLFVLDNYGKPIGLLHLQDLIAFGLR